MIKKIKLATAIFAFLGLIAITNAVMASKATLVLFYTSWDVNSRQALSVVQQAVENSAGKVSLYKINIDKPSAPEEASNLGLSIPNKAPSIFIINDNKVLYQGGFKTETPVDIKRIIDNTVR